MDFLLYLAGGALVGVLFRWWRPLLGWAWIAGYWVIAGTLFAPSLLGTAVQVPADIAYLWRPWSEMVEGPVVPAIGLLSDVPLQMIPFRALVRDRLLHLRAPLWANEIGTGQPLLGNAQSAPFSPLALLTLPLPPVRALPVAAALKLFLSLLSMHALLAALGAGRAGAAFAALAFTFSVYSICWGLYPIGMAAAWLPGVFLGLLLLRRGEPGGLAGLTACATGMALSGHPETLAHTGAAAGLVVAAMLLIRHGAPRGRYLAGLAAAAALTAGLAAPVLLPVLDALPESVRATVVTRSTKGVMPPPFRPGGVNLVFDPLANGSPVDRDWAPGSGSNYNELCSGYAGLLALALAIAAALALRGRVLALLAGGAAALAAALAIPPFLGLVMALPLLDHAANARLRLLWVLAVAVAAGLGLEPLAARRGGRWVAGACCAAAAIGLALERRPAAPPWQLAWWVATLAGCGLTALAFLALAAAGGRRRGNTTEGAAVAPATQGENAGAELRESSRELERTGWEPRAAAWLPWLAVGALALDLGLLEGRFVPVLPSQFDLAAPPALEVLAHELRADPAAPFRVAGSGDILRPNLAALYGLWDLRDDDPMHPAGARLVIGKAIRSDYRIQQPLALVQRPYPVPFLGYMGVRYMLTRHHEELFPPWKAAWNGQGGKLWRNPEALPLFFVPASWRPARDPGDAIAATVTNQDFSAAAVAEIPKAAGLEVSRHSPEGSTLRRQEGRVRLRAVHANGFELDVVGGGAAGGAGGGGALVVSSVTYCRGWRLAVDGRQAGLVRVNAGFLGFLLPPGSHRATLEYRPAGWVWGLRLCGLTIAAILAALGWRAAGLRRRRPPEARPPIRAPAPPVPPDLEISA